MTADNRAESPIYRKKPTPKPQKMDSRSEVTFRANDSKACKSLVASENALKTLSSSLGCAEGLR